MEQEAHGQSARLGVGAALKAAREQAGMSLGEVAERLKLSVRQLDAIEKDDFQQLPGATFVRGFVRNYARFLKVDAEPLMAQLEEHFPSAVNDVVNLVKQEQAGQPASMAETLARVPPPAAAAGKTGKWLLLLVVAAAVAGGALWLAGRQGSAAPAPAQALQPMLTQQAASAPAASAPLAATASAAVVAEPATPAAAAASQAAAQPTAVAAAAVTASAASPAGSAGKAAASAAVADAASGHIQLNAQQAAWISVIDATGKKLQYGTLEAGSSKELTGTPPFQLKIGNAAQVQLSFNGQPVALTDKIRGTTAKIELK
ncbi:RodZ domain-containing protein [Aquitalea magnusonii]|uniref:Cytoskeleton protein RodZ n=1 Tax=Aquitalea magnusonii TaxID=332411 RepID=A0A318JAS6_9NEIS|nr:RodZ domain-containing protein [Aquitalea magnusonii]PXX44602.1 cytoskeleton protein RodZ [Aquitalea magnusonii]